MRLVQPGVSEYKEMRGLHMTAHNKFKRVPFLRRRRRVVAQAGLTIRRHTMTANSNSRMLPLSDKKATTLRGVAREKRCGAPEEIGRRAGIHQVGCCTPEGRRWQILIVVHEGVALWAEMARRARNDQQGG